MRFYVLVMTTKLMVSYLSHKQLAKTKLKAYISNLLLWYRQDDGYADIYIRRLPTEALKAIYHETMAITNSNDISEELDWLVTLSEFLELISRLETILYIFRLYYLDRKITI